MITRTQNWELIGSDIIVLESSKNPDAIRTQKIMRLHDSASIKTRYNMNIKLRAKQFREYGIKLFDSLHLASAEYACADVLLTTDKKFLNASSRCDIKIRVENPLIFYMEVLSYE